MSPQEIADLLRRIEEEIRGENRYNLPPDLCAEYAKLPVALRIAYGRPLELAGCDDITVPINPEIDIPQEDRIRGACWIMWILGGHTENPTWSSGLIKRLWDCLLLPPSMRVADVVMGLSDALEPWRDTLPVYVGRFIEAVMWRGRMRYWKSYEDEFQPRYFEQLVY